MENKKTILVTGGAGFIGSAVAKRLCDAGHTVVVVDNFNTYYDVTLKRARQNFFLTDCTVVEADIADKEAMQKLFANNSFDVVCHLAGQAGVRYSVEAPEVYVHSNVLGMLTLLEVMKEYKVKQMVFASTSSVYGNTATVPFKEVYPAAEPVSVYAATKRSAELLAHSYFTQYGIATTCLRFFTVYGPWGRPDMALFSFTKNIKEGKAIDVYNNGDHRRDFTYIDDIVNGFVLAVEKPLRYQIINLGNSQPVTLATYIETLEKTLGVVAQKNMLPMQVGDVYETYADISKARELLGYEPKTAVAEGIAQFVAWYESYFNKNL